MQYVVLILNLRRHSLWMGSAQQRTCLLRKLVSPALAALNSSAPLVIFIPLTPVFLIQYQLPSCYIWGPPTSAVWKWLLDRRGGVKHFTSGPLPHLSCDLKMHLMSPKLTCMLMFPSNIISRLNLINLHAVKSELYWLLLDNNCNTVIQFHFCMFYIIGHKVNKYITINFSVAHQWDIFYWNS